MADLKAGMVLRHHSGRVYTVLHIANPIPSKRFPETVVYMGANGDVWTRPLDQFDGKFSVIFDGVRRLTSPGT